MTRAAAARKYPHLNRWPVAGIVTARADRLKTPRTLGFPTTADRPMRMTNVANRRKRTDITSATRICRAIAHSSKIGACLKTP